MKSIVLMLVLAASEYPVPNIREEQRVVVNGVSETWQLVWKTAPHPGCEPADTSLTCPCTGFAYGEAGDLDLVRMRDGKEIDRLNLNSFFTDAPEAAAVVQRWAADYEHDFDAFQSPGFARQVARRATVQVMHFADYDHDGASTEFYLQTEARPCGKNYGIVVGVSKRNPHLHALGTALHPDTPLSLQKAEWEGLRGAAGPIEMQDWQCEDHGADKETAMLLRSTPEGISVMKRQYSCPGGMKTGKLLSTVPF